MSKQAVLDVVTQVAIKYREGRVPARRQCPDEGPLDLIAPTLSTGPRRDRLVLQIGCSGHYFDRDLVIGLIPASR